MALVMSNLSENDGVSSIIKVLDLNPETNIQNREICSVMIKENPNLDSIVLIENSQKILISYIPVDEHSTELPSQTIYCDRIQNIVYLTEDLYPEEKFDPTADNEI